VLVTDDMAQILGLRIQSIARAIVKRVWRI